MSQEYENLPFEDPSFVQNMDSNLKLLLETFMMLDEYKMVIVLKQFYRIVKLLKQNKNEENPPISEKIPKEDSVFTMHVENISEDENAPETIQEDTSAKGSRQNKKTVKLGNFSQQGRGGQNKICFFPNLWLGKKRGDKLR